MKPWKWGFSSSWAVEAIELIRNIPVWNKFMLLMILWDRAILIKHTSLSAKSSFSARVVNTVNTLGHFPSGSSCLQMVAMNWTNDFLTFWLKCLKSIFCQKPDHKYHSTIIQKTYSGSPINVSKIFSLILQADKNLVFLIIKIKVHSLLLLNFWSNSIPLLLLCQFFHQQNCCILSDLSFNNVNVFSNTGPVIIQWGNNASLLQA